MTAARASKYQKDGILYHQTSYCIYHIPSCNKHATNANRIRNRIIKMILRVGTHHRIAMRIHRCHHATHDVQHSFETNCHYCYHNNKKIDSDIGWAIFEAKVERASRFNDDLKKSISVDISRVHLQSRHSHQTGKDNCSNGLYTLLADRVLVFISVSSCPSGQK